MQIEDDELLELVKGGAKVLHRPTAPAAPKEAPKPSDASLIVAAIQKLAAAISSAPKPSVNVASPQVSVRPEIKIPEEKRPLRWRVTNITRDNSPERLMTGFDFVAGDDELPAPPSRK